MQCMSTTYTVHKLAMLHVTTTTLAMYNKSVTAVHDELQT